MNHKLLAGLGCSLLLVQAGLVGCTVAEDGAGGDGGSVDTEDTTTSAKSSGSGESSKSGGSPSSGDTGSGNGSGSGATSGGGDCGSQPDYEACDECVCNANLDGCDSYWEVMSNACACGVGSPCEAACANSCQNEVDDPNCDACWESLGDEAPCYAEADAACASDPACAGYLDASAICYAGEEDDA